MFLFVRKKLQINKTTFSKEKSLKQRPRHKKTGLNRKLTNYWSIKKSLIRCNFIHMQHETFIQQIEMLLQIFFSITLLLLILLLFITLKYNTTSCESIIIWWLSVENTLESACWWWRRKLDQRHAIFLINYSKIVPNSVRYTHVGYIQVWVIQFSSDSF